MDMETIRERAERFVSNFSRCEQSLARECYIRGSYDQKEIDDKDKENLEDELDVIRMQYLSQVSLWKSKYKESIDKACKWLYQTEFGIGMSKTELVDKFRNAIADDINFGADYSKEEIDKMVIKWLNAHQAGYIEMNEEWMHFVRVVSDCCYSVVKDVTYQTTRPSSPESTPDQDQT